MNPVKSVLVNLYAAICTMLVKRTAGSYGDDLRVNRLSSVTKQTYLGDNVNFNGIKVMGAGEVRIGDNFHSGEEIIVITQNHDYEGEAIPYDDSYIVDDILIEDNVWLGHGVIVLPGVTIGEGAIIQAGSAVTSDIPRCGIAGGHPAKVFDHRDQEHYRQLKSENQFH